MKVLVTRGAGYIGAHTVVELCTRGYEVVILIISLTVPPKSLRGCKV